MTQAPPEDKKERAPRTEAEVGLLDLDFDSLPASNRGRASKLNTLLDQVKTDFPGQWKAVATYEKAGAASAQASTLKAKYGPVDANGWEFAVRKIENGNKSALFVKFTPESIVDGQREAYNRERAKREAARLAKKAEKDEKASKKEEKASARR